VPGARRQRPRTVARWLDARGRINAVSCVFAVLFGQSIEAEVSPVVTARPNLESPLHKHQQRR
jgi:hypothetical protein